MSEVRSFHGLVSFYKRFHSQTLQNLELECDASYVGIGAVLLQERHHIPYLNERLKGAYLNYSTYDKEFYSLVKALHIWQHYLCH
ncbi:Tf2-6, partial [Mucuna pruriens]